MEKYTVVKPEDYTKEHLAYIDQFKDSTDFLATQMKLMFSLKNTDFRGIIGSDESAKVFGLKSGQDFADRHIVDYPCEGIAKCAEQITQQEQELINSCDVNKKLEVLCVFEYCDGLKSVIANKHLFHHKPSASILGIIGDAKNVKLGEFINIIPTYILRFGAVGSMEPMEKNIKIQDVMLSEYEQEICFLFLLGWGFKQIADFMDVFRPDVILRTVDTVNREKNYICQKLGLTGTNLKNLCEYLFSLGFHTKIPESFYQRIIGAKVIN